MTRRSKLDARWLLGIPALALSVGCLDTVEPQGGSSRSPVEGMVQELRAGRGRRGDVFLGVDVLVTDSAGNAVPCNTGTMALDVKAKVVATGQELVLPASAVTTRCSEGTAEIAMVLDNSGSEKRHVALVQAAAHELADPVLADGGRVSLVRVSTVSSKKSELTEDATVINDAISSLGVTNGWTALYDGIRMGNETLGSANLHDPRKDRYGSAAAFCEASGKLAIVAVTDGNENNSAGQRLTSTQDDGLDTRLEDLYKLNVNGITTPVHTVGVGKNVNHGELRSLSRATGGKNVAIDSFDDLPQVFSAISEYANQSQKVCTTLPVDVCGDVEVEVAYTFTPADGAPITGTRTEKMYVECDFQPLTGRSVFVGMTMSNAGSLDPQVAEGIISRTIDWVSPTTGPKVLVVLDDDHHGEYAGDADYVTELLAEAGYEVTRLEEPSDGLSALHVAGYDVVWFTNPGYPVDDEASMYTLREFLQKGGGVVLQGDDMAQSYGYAFNMAPNTHVNFVDNGTYYCGRGIDNNAGSEYTVTFENVEHDIVGDLGGTSFTYGNDIDMVTQAMDGEVVLAYAGAAWDASCARTPVIVAYDPDPTIARQVGGKLSEGGLLHLTCSYGQVVTSIDFASYGNPSGTLPNFSEGSCHATSSLQVASDACLGKNSCKIGATNAEYGDPCPGVGKSLAVVATCAAAP